MPEQFIKKETLLNTERMLTDFIDATMGNPVCVEATAVAMNLRLAIQKELIGRR